MTSKIPCKDLIVCGSVACLAIAPIACGAMAGYSLASGDLLTDGLIIAGCAIAGAAQRVIFTQPLAEQSVSLSKHQYNEQYALEKKALGTKQLISHLIDTVNFGFCLGVGYGTHGFFNGGLLLSGGYIVEEVHVRLYGKPVFDKKGNQVA